MVINRVLKKWLNYVNKQEREEKEKWGKLPILITFDNNNHLILFPGITPQSGLPKTHWIQTCVLFTPLSETLL